MQTLFSKREVLDNIKAHYNLKGNGALAAFLGITPSTLSNWYTRETLDYDLILTKCETMDLNQLFKTVVSESNISLSLAAEPSAQYNRTESERIQELKATIKIQNDFIELLKSQIPDRDATGASVADAS